jgi:hypothetical protein
MHRHDHTDSALRRRVQKSIPWTYAIEHFFHFSTKETLADGKGILPFSKPCEKHISNEIQSPSRHCA